MKDPRVTLITMVTKMILMAVFACSTSQAVHPLLISRPLYSFKSLCETEGYFVSAQDCRNFYRCVALPKSKFQRYDFQCSNGTIFDPSIPACNYPERVTPKPKCRLITSAPVESEVDSVGQHMEEDNVTSSNTMGTMNRHEVLKHNIYEINWRINFEKQTAEFQATVKTKGFVGFGLSYTGSMVGADIIIGGVFPNGTTYFTDRYATAFQQPKIDPHQDWKLIEGRENETHTILRFTRSLDTCDENDIAIKNDTIKIIWSYGKSDVISYHGSNRGSVAVNLLDNPNPQPDLSEFKAWRVAQALEMPPTDTIYWCTFFKGPMLSKKHHMVGFDIFLNGTTSKEHTHHADLYKCTPPNGEDPDDFFGKYLGYGNECYFSKDYIPIEHCQLFELQWTIGGKATIFPDNLGVPIGEEPMEYYMTEIHYNNIDELSGLTLHSGFEIYYTDKLREIDAGFLQIGVRSSKAYSITIPPYSENFVVSSHCAPACTSNFPPEGLNVFVYLLHSHLSGRKEKLRHFRNNEELAWIANDEHFDFSYQTNRPLKSHVKLLPGDHLSLECTYDTTWKMGGATLGGRSTRDEMCQTFLMIYPRITTVNQCGSDFPQGQMLDYMGIEEVLVEKGIVDPTITSPAHLKGLKYSYVVENKIDWSMERRLEFQNMTRFSPQESYCFPFSSSGNFSLSQYPIFQKEFNIPDKCTSRD